MENYLYFRKLRPKVATATFSGSSNATDAFTGVGVAANLDNINEIASLSVTSFDGGGTGHASILFETTAVLPAPTYSSTALAIATGSIHYLNPANQALSNGVITLDGHGTTGGYTLDTGDTDDVVTIEHANGKFEDICKLMNDACNAFPRDGRLVSVIDLGFGETNILGGSNPASITSIEYAPEGGAAGMAT